MIEMQIGKLEVAFRVGRALLLPMPRCGTFSMAEWANDRGFAYEKPTPLSGPIATFIRDPFDRLVSAYHLRFDSGSSYWGAECSFEQFVLDAEQCADIHVKPQSELLAGLDVQFLGRYENLAEDWKRFCEWAGVEHTPLGRYHRSDRTDGREYYSPELRARVAERYRADCEACRNA